MPSVPASSSSSVPRLASCRKRKSSELAASPAPTSLAKSGAPSGDSSKRRRSSEQRKTARERKSTEGDASHLSVGSGGDAAAGDSRSNSSDSHRPPSPSPSSAPASSSSSDSETAAKRTSREGSPRKSQLLSKLQSFSGEGHDMGNCVGKKSSITHDAPGAGKEDKAVVEALTRSPERTAKSPVSSDDEEQTAPAPKGKSPVTGKHGSRRRLSLIHADPITHQSEEGPRGVAQIIQKRPTEQRLSLEGVLSKDGAGTRVSIMGAAAHTHQKNFEDKNETCRGNVTGETLITMGIGHACRKGLKPESPNQDDFFIIRIENIGLYGVFDGHGPFGHDISNFVQQNLPKLIYNHPDFYVDPKNTLKTAFHKVQEDIEKACDRRDFDAALSGCTATVIIHDIDKRKLFVAHVGDSRAVLAQRATDGQTKAVDLTNDHKPTLENEKARIEAKGGEVKRLEGDIPYRVFLKDKMYPGLAMSRALGDLVAGQAGVSPEPDISEWKIEQNKDLFIVLCSDGVWEFISSQESVDLVNKHGQKEVQTAADALARESWNKWIVEEGDVVDDITVEVIYLF